jgi:flagellar motor protein MotB
MKFPLILFFQLYFFSSLLLIPTAGVWAAGEDSRTTGMATVRSSDPDPVLRFSNLNRKPYYQNKRKLRAITRLEKKKKYGRALKRLEQYVSRFGIENFKKDTPLLWRLGQLYEKGGKPERAKAYYRLALKHHPADLTLIQLYYDSLEQKDSDYYVPLQQYYNLVEHRKLVSTFVPPRGESTNLGYEVNSAYEDYGPTLNAADEILIFTSKRNRREITEKPNEDLFYTRFESGYWDEAKPFGKPINSQYNEGSACLSKDGKTLYFARCECPECFGNCDLFVATLLKDGSWGNVRNLGPNVNSPAWDSHPTLSVTEDTLYFASDRFGGFGLSDLYFTYKDKNGEWTPAQNMGPIVNTRGNEVSPFLHPQYNVLYFSSTGQLLNFGEFDIYKTFRIEGQWQEPRNIGPLINGKGSEYYFTIDRQSKNLYYARSEEKELVNLDLYSFPLPMEAHPLATTRFEGFLTDSLSSGSLHGIVSIIDLSNGVEVAPRYIRPDGSFAFDLIDNSRYLLVIQGEDFFSVEREFELKGDTSLALMATVIDYSLPLTFKNIEFDGGKSEIKEEMEPILDRIVLFLADHPTVRLRISGHTDGDGDSQANLELSEWRAIAIKNYLVEKGNLAPDRIDAFGFGNTQPVRDEMTAEDKRINRRVEFKLIKEM